MLMNKLSIPLLGRYRFLVLLFGDHAKAAPEIITLLATLGKQRVLCLATKDRTRRSKLDIARTGRVRAYKRGGDRGHRRLERVRGTGHSAGRRRPIHKGERLRERRGLRRSRLASSGGCNGAGWRKFECGDGCSIPGTGSCQRNGLLVVLFLPWRRWGRDTLLIIEWIVEVVIEHSVHECVHILLVRAVHVRVVPVTT